MWRRRYLPLLLGLTSVLLLAWLRVADPYPVRALLVHAKDETARQWYLSWEFEPSPSDPFHLFLLVKDLKAMVSG